MARAKFTRNTNAIDAIFNKAIPLFAQSGFSGVSMRHVATAVEISIATLYHHFPDKQTLYLRCIEEAFSNKAEDLSEVLSQKSSPEEQLKAFIYQFTYSMSEDENFRRLLQRELLDGDKARLQFLAEDVFLTQFKGIIDLAKMLSPNCDAHMTAISMAGLVLFHLETTPIRQFLPEVDDKHNDVEFIAEHVTQLLLNGVMKCGAI